MQSGRVVMTTKTRSDHTNQQLTRQEEEELEELEEYQLPIKVRDVAVLGNLQHVARRI